MHADRLDRPHVGGAQRACVNCGFVAACFLGGVASPPLPADLVGPTHLTITFRRVARSAADPGATTVATLDCGGGTSTGVADPALACATLDTHWLRYLPPTAGVCSGPLTDSVWITGTFRGVAVDRYGPGCTGVDRDAWAAVVSASPPQGNRP